jgi:hypothetical protein
MGLLRGCDSRLIEGNRDDGMAAAIADVADVDGQIVARLPLHLSV